MSTLHLLSHSPFSDSSFASCLRLLSPSDAILLTGDAVYALRPATTPYQALEQRPQDVALFALEEDLQARNLTSNTLASSIDYPAFVELCGQYDKVNSWL